MYRPIALLLIAMGMLCPSLAAAADKAIITGLDAFKPAGQSAEAMGRFSSVDVADQPFAKATRAQTTGSPANRWDIALQAPVAEAIKPGDLLAVRFWIRTHEAMADEGVVGISVELNREPYEKLAEGQYNAPRQWKQIHLPFAARKAFDAGTVSVNFRLGYPMQTVEVGGFELVRLPAGTKLETLPRTSVAYRGMEDDAPWRTAAMERIEKIRKADLTVAVRDRWGKPLADRPVRITLTRHAFRFGTAVDARLLLADSAAADQYRKHLTANFNAAVFENDLKWPAMPDTARQQSVDKALAWLAERNIETRGHVLVWPGLKWLPPEVRALKDDPAKLREAVNQHVTQTATRFRGRLADWDVLNEPFTNRDLEKILGREAYVEWFKLARLADPSAKLFINDFGILETGNRLDTEHQKHYEDTIKFLLDNGAPLDGIGIQGHFGSAVTDPEKMLAILDRFAKFGKPIRITELDANMLDPELRANFLRDVLIVCFSHPSVDGVLQWGFWEGRHWQPESALFDREWNLRRHGQAYQSQVASWTTDVTAVTGPDGSVKLRGFIGDYSVGTGGTTQKLSLPSGGATAELVAD